MSSYSSRTAKIIKQESSLVSRTDLESSSIALKTLTPAEFKFWFYAMKNSNGFSLNISMSAVTSACGFSHNSYTRAFDGLVRKGYIRAISGSSSYEFYESPNMP